MEVIFRKPVENEEIEQLLIEKDNEIELTGSRIEHILKIEKTQDSTR